MTTLAEIYETLTPGSEGFVKAVQTHCGFEISNAEIARIAEQSPTPQQFESNWKSAYWWKDGNQPRNYKIVRRYFQGGRRTIQTGLTLEQAQAHCSDSETSSSTCTGSKARARTRARGPWFDGYELER